MKIARAERDSPALSWTVAFFCYYGGRFSADGDFPGFAPDAMYIRRSTEQSGRFLQNHVEDSPSTAGEIHGGLRDGDVTLLDRIRHIGAWVHRGADSYWEDRPDDSDARMRYNFENKNGVPILVISGRRAEFHCPELLYVLEGRI